MWPYLFNRICVCLVVMQLFTFCVFLVKQAFVQARTPPLHPCSCHRRCLRAPALAIAAACCHCRGPPSLMP
jgi:hypothetical protein